MSQFTVAESTIFRDCQILVLVEDGVRLREVKVMRLPEPQRTLRTADSLCLIPKAHGSHPGYLSP